MAERAEDEIINQFRGVLGSVRGILLYGSRVCGYADSTSDTDLCLILHDNADRTAVYTSILNAEPQYDIVVYDEIPWYLRGRILEHHHVVYAEDPEGLDFWLHKQRRVWQDMKRRQQPASLDDLLTRAGR
ncbi:nucleotidyltransferase domain-containing protein [Methanoculleus sp. FWC-SCC1]|uniref:Nucleotidyltransferase domain-containing protein n=1 Tax=Methanoculleus frigidifontis TaxID=2584085 RepID=A0ABT8M6I4_9EURY|nr:nucleotidyltransferase domain-containing protein [Methanoculleus sp. FWC-SCC1]MDN7023548.1 nucleotidyltransferase domain-containing protein [Methanoculleus sp. FWC-SCC1]